ncbi:hypothetical protein ALO83_104074 [Pseudomonas cannabina pv. alisalensis]|uniref:Uncharacterized protein n=1 Tax=Pseudomonas cannabina TaxID=86840 RepID=A0A3M3RCM3_PSECA|nr:Unknown protein sequence [Pseudomonas syringae pv. maculicola]KPW19143.1 hypothetical protein ALO83_104074 [Pseudomonas cannabina pv. alisalensis]RMN84035.1 hypothetical protein ALQ53_103801 [Pseudomonas cannabina]RMN89012.1 hypothetical protein ALQ52_104809 [Pseudomonas cannabina pv. alisalensis]RMN94093.1 hypothetical protein ALQ51_102381 [Pseudomonas cannabina]
MTGHNREKFRQADERCQTPVAEGSGMENRSPALPYIPLRSKNMV